MDDVQLSEPRRPLGDRSCDRAERPTGLLDDFTGVVDDSPAPFGMNGSRKRHDLHELPPRNLSRVQLTSNAARASAYQRLPREPPCPPPYPPRPSPRRSPPEPEGLATSTLIWRPSSSVPFRRRTASLASSEVVISTNPKPRDRPESRSVTTLAESTPPTAANASRRRSLDVENESPPTKSLTATTHSLLSLPFSARPEPGRGSRRGLRLRRVRGEPTVRQAHLVYTSQAPPAKGISGPRLHGVTRCRQCDFRRDPPASRSLR